jgi:mono/diheme cytochrome c family protein
MNRRQLVYLLSFCLICVYCLCLSCAIRKSEPITGKTVDNSDPRLRKGEMLYMMYCDKCHPSGEGGLGSALNPLHVPSFIKRFQVRHGLGVMPYFKQGQITKEDLHDITHYMKALKHL